MRRRSERKATRSIELRLGGIEGLHIGSIGLRIVGRVLLAFVFGAWIHRFRLHTSAI